MEQYGNYDTLRFITLARGPTPAPFRYETAMCPRPHSRAVQHCRAGALAAAPGLLILVIMPNVVLITRSIWC